MYLASCRAARMSPELHHAALPAQGSATEPSVQPRAHFPHRNGVVEQQELTRARPLCFACAPQTQNFSQFRQEAAICPRLVKSRTSPSCRGPLAASFTHRFTLPCHCADLCTKRSIKGCWWHLQHILVQHPMRTTSRLHCHTGSSRSGQRTWPRRTQPQLRGRTYPHKIPLKPEACSNSTLFPGYF